MRWILIDTETTGGSPRQGDRVVDLGLAEMIDGRRTGRTWQSYFDPSPREVQWGAQRVHGLSTEFLRGKPRFSARAAEVLDFIGGSPCLAHNAPFDRGFVLHEFHASGLPLPQLAFHDTIPLARAAIRSEHYKLDALVALLDVKTPPRAKHGALLDAQILGQVLEAIEARKPGHLAGYMARSHALTGALPFLPPHAAPPWDTRRGAAPTDSPQPTPAPRSRLPEAALSAAEARIRDAAAQAFAAATSLRAFVDHLRAAGILCRPNVKFQDEALSGFRFTNDEASVTGARVEMVGSRFQAGPLAYVHARDAGWMTDCAAEHDRRFGPIAELLERLKRGERPALAAEDAPSP